MQVLIIRHAPAEDLLDTHTSDADRELTHKGRKLFRELVEQVIKSDGVPELVLYSPLVRTRQTAEIFQEVTGISKDRVRAEKLLRPGMAATQLVNLLQDLPEQRVAIVGHNPDVSHCTMQLIGGGALEFKKGSMAMIDFGGSVQLGLGRLSWFVYPKLLVED
jgi:phosphohistidine phosphatase